MALRPEQVETLNGRQFDALVNLAQLAKRDKPVGYGPEAAGPVDTCLLQLTDMGLAAYSFKLEGYVITAAGKRYLTYFGGELYND